MPDVKPRGSLWLSLRLSPLLWAMVAVALAAALASAAGIPVRASYGAQTTGDEPHYLVTALSLAEDGGLDVSDEVDAGRYRPFHEQRLPDQAVRQPDGTMVVPHDPLLPALLAVPVAVGGWVAAKAALAALAGALAAVLVWTAVRRLGVSLRAATVTVLAVAASAPFAVYGNQVYPELPAALAVAAALAALAGPPPERGAGIARPAVAVAWLAVAALPWLGVKYVPVAATLAIFGMIWARRGLGAGGAAWLAGGFACAGLLYLGAHLAWYGGMTVYAAGDFFAEHGGQLSVVGVEPNYLGRSTRLLGLLVGRDFGLAAWQPAWLLVVPAGAALLRHRPAGWDLLLAPLAVGWLAATFVAATMQGWWFPGRQVVVVLPAAVLALAWWAGRSRHRLALVAAMGTLGVVGYGYLVTEGALGRLTWVVDFFTTGYPWYRLWRLALPDYLEITAGTWVRHGLWLAILVAAALCSIRSRERAGGTILPVMSWRRKLNKALGQAVGLELRRVPQAQSESAPAPEPARRPDPEIPARVVDPEIDRLLSAPVFILGSVRSGSTLLRVVLGSHSQLHAPHELHVRRLQVMFETKLSERAMAELDLDEYELEHLLWDRVLHRELVKSGKNFIVEKTPSNAFVWRRLLQCWPDARFIFLLRHPVSIARSWHEASPEKRTLEEATTDALRYMNAVEKARRGLTGLTVRYEDLTADPEREARRICEFLGIDWEPEMLQYGDRTNGAFQKGLGDWKDKIRSGTVQPGRPLPDPDEVPDRLRRLCRSWGYLERARTG